MTDQITSTTPKGHAAERQPLDRRQQASRREAEGVALVASFQRVHVIMKERAKTP
jgi:hypothetical protein